MRTAEKGWCADPGHYCAASVRIRTHTAHRRTRFSAIFELNWTGTGIGIAESLLSFPASPTAPPFDMREARGPQPAPSRTLSRPLVLAVDADVSVLEVIGPLTSQLGFDLETCASAGAALRVLAHRSVGLALVDLSTFGPSDQDLLNQFRTTAPGCEVVLMGFPDALDSAVNAIKRGARDYITKPVDPERLRRVLNRLCQEAGTRAHIFELEAQIAEQTEYRGMIGRGPAMQGVFSVIERLAPHAKHVLITGETGTGKELVARAFHQAGPRRAQPFVIVNGSTLAGALFDSDVEAANGGTLFVDEIGELSAEMQTRLLRVLDRGVGGRDPHPVDVAVVAVSSRNLRAEVANRRFNSDLFDRLSFVEVGLPTLRDRREDIPYLTAAFVRECAHRFHKSFDGLTPLAEHALLSARWDGNVRELRNLIERACMLADGKMISERELAGPGAAFPVNHQRAGQGTISPLRVVGHSDEPQTAHLDYLEREHIVDTLRQLGGNRMATAKALGISRRALYRRLERHHITHPASRNRSRT